MFARPRIKRYVASRRRVGFNNSDVFRHYRTLFEQMPKDEYVLSPIMINDNVIDLLVKPAGVG